MGDFKVFPSQKVPAEDIQVSACDAHAIKGWVTHTLFWALHGSAEKSYEVLKEGLARTLTEIPALAGTLRRSGEGYRAVYIELKEGDGVEFTYQDLSTNEQVPSYETLKGSGFPMMGIRPALSPPATLGVVLENSAMMVAKLVQLKGGLALTVGFNHVLADGATASVIETIWAQHTKDVSAGTTQSHKQITPDAEIRERLSTAPAEAGEMSTKVWHRENALETLMHLHKDMASFAPVFQKMSQGKMAYLASKGRIPGETFWCIWNFSAGNLAQLKKDASVSDPEKWISTADALAGLLWSRIAITLKSSSKGESMSTAVFNMNIRSRLDPPIPNDYIGNVVSTHVAECSLAELENPDTGMQAGAQSMRKTVNEWSQKDWDAYMKNLTTLPTDQALGIEKALMFEPNRIALNDFSKFQSNTNDWGSDVGVPDRARYSRPAAVHAGGAVATWIYPKLKDGSLEVAMSLSKDQNEALEKDEVFRRYAEFVCLHP